MIEEKSGMRPIWYFVGWILLLTGLMVVLAGIYGLFAPLPSTSVMDHLHPNLWWGTLMIIFGLIYIVVNKNVRVE